MTRIHIIVREIGRLKPDYSLPFDVDAIPNIGDYISIFRPDSETHTEDVVVRRLWWHLASPERQDSISTAEPRPGKVREVMLECEVAIGPYARDNWLKLAEAAEHRGAEVVRFDVARFSVRESELAAMAQRQEPSPETR